MIAATVFLALVACVVVISHVLTRRRLEVIHDLVNSNLTRAQADLVLAHDRINKLEESLTSKLGT